MEWLNNLNTIISVIIGIFGIVGYIFGITTYLRNKVAAAQRKQISQIAPSHKPSSQQTEPKPLSTLDWWQVLWEGFEDSVKAKDGYGWFVSLIIGVVGIFLFSQFVSFYKGNIVAIICLVVFVMLWFSLNLLFYTYFVGRRIEKKIEGSNRNRPQVIKNTRHH